MRHLRGSMKREREKAISEGLRGVSPALTVSRVFRQGSSCSGQYTLEWAVLMMAVAAVVVLMAPYVRDSLRANVKSTEMQLNAAMQDNRP